MREALLRVMDWLADFGPYLAVALLGAVVVVAVLWANDWNVKCLFSECRRAIP